METSSAAYPTKGQRTRERIIVAARDLFARQGYEATTLRQVAAQAGIREPGLYNHFASKQALYEVVLYRTLQPLAQAVSAQLSEATGLRDYTDLPALITDLMLARPESAPLLQQALHGGNDSVGSELLQQWLADLFKQGMHSAGILGTSRAQDPAELAINVLALLNLVTGYFMSQRAFAAMTDGEVTDPQNIARQKRVLHRVVRALLIS
jgi:AcrR family transcriptional regulator